MKRFFTTFLVVLCLACTARLVQAQTPALDVTIREINAIPEANINELKLYSASLTNADIQRLIRSPLDRQLVRFTGVVVGEPRYSGLASVTGSGQPGRVHFFVRDTSAARQGPGGQVIQVVDQNFQANGLLGLFKGDVLRITGVVTYFNPATLQITPESIEFLGDYQSMGLPASIIEPVTVTTADINMNVGEAKVQANWDNFNDLNQQYVRIEDATIWRVLDRTGARPNWTITSDGAETIVQHDDISVCFRNDRTNYPAEFAECKDEPFEAPPPGATVDVEGFVVLRGSFNPFAIGQPPAGMLYIAPWEENDVTITVLPAITSVELAPLTSVPGNGPIPITLTVEGDADAVATAVVRYGATGSTETSTATLTRQSGGTFTGEIPTQPHGSFLTYSAEVTTQLGETFSTLAPTSTRVLYGGIDDLIDIQQTIDNGTGAGPFRGVTSAMNVTATVQTDPATAGFLAVQDGTGPWSGIFIQVNEAIQALGLVPGDQVRITRGTVIEIPGDLTFATTGTLTTTALSGVTLEKISSGAPYAPIGLTTDAVQDQALAEAFEGMLVRFEDVLVTSPNPDAPAGDFGEFAFATRGASGSVRADDASAEIPETFHDMFEGGERLAFVQGIWAQGFGTFRVIPRGLSDVGAITNVAAEDEVLPGTFALAQNYPNPFNPVTTIQYSLATTGRVTLEVVDLLGRTVATLVDGDYAPGVYQARFDGQGMASGLYLYRLSAGGQTTTKKMMLLK